MLVFALASPLACGGRSSTTADDPEADGAGKDSGGSSSTAGTRSSAGSAGPSAGGAAPAGGAVSGGAAVSGGGAPGYAGRPSGTGGMPGADPCSSSGGGGLDAAPLDAFAGTKNAFGFALQDSFFLTRCLEVSGHDCRTQLDVCPNQDAANYEDRGRVFVEQFQLRGCAGKTYLITFKVNGVVEGKYYEGGLQRDGINFENANSPTGTDAWYVGGKPLPSTYNSFKMTVLEPDGETEVQHYYLNSFPQHSGLESHQTVLLGYEATIEAPGQGIVRLSHHDSNCRAMNNCGPGGLRGCPSPRHVPNEPGLAVPSTYGGKPVDATFNIVNGAQQPFHAQIVHLTVTKVELKR